MEMIEDFEETKRKHNSIRSNLEDLWVFDDIWDVIVTKLWFGGIANQVWAGVDEAKK